MEVGKRLLKWAGTIIAILCLCVTALHAQAQSATGSIAGRVYSRSGTISSSFVRVYSSVAPVTVLRQVSTDSQGVYSIEDLAPGTYYLQTFGSHKLSQYYVDEIYGGVSCPENICEVTKGMLVPVAAGQVTSQIDFELEAAMSISGRIAGFPSGATSSVGLSGAEAILYDGAGKFFLSKTSDFNGDYEFKTLTAGSYFLSTKNSAGFIDELYSNDPCPASSCDIFMGNKITLSSSNKHKTASFVLWPGGLLSGKVTNALSKAGIPYVTVQVYDSNGRYVKADSTKSNGEFIFDGGLEPGTYFVTVSKVGYVSQLFGFGECTGDCPLRSGTPVKVTPNAMTSGIDFVIYSKSESPSNADSDKDGTFDIRDGCDFDPKKTAPGVCGCGKADADSNANGVIDCLANAELKAEFAVILARIRALRPLSLAYLPNQSRLRAELSGSVLAVNTTMQSFGTAIALKAGTPPELEIARLSFNRSLRNLLRKSGDLRMARRKVTRAIARISDLLA